jgi:hypothetical protein
MAKPFQIDASRFMGTKKIFRFKRPGRGLARLIAACLALAGSCESANATTLLTEHFNAEVSDNAPLGKAGWHAFALNNGRVTDFTTSTPDSDFPTLSHGPMGAASDGIGYLVLGAGNRVSNILAWTDAPSDFAGRTLSEVSFYTRNESSASTERIAVRAGHQWFVSAKTFHHHGGDDAWSLNIFQFEPGTASWRRLNTNNLTLAANRAESLPGADITALGFFGEIPPDAGKIRIDEVQVTGFTANAAPEIQPLIVSPGSNVFEGSTLVLEARALGTRPVQYQWRKNGSLLKTKSSARSSITFTTATLNDSGNYDVIVSNPFGTNISTAVAVTVSKATPAQVDLSKYDSNGLIHVSQADTNSLAIQWTDKSGALYRVHFNLKPGRALLGSLETATQSGAPFGEIARQVDPKFRVTFGSRYHKAGWPYIFFDRVDANEPAPVVALSSLNPKTVRVISESPLRTRVVFSGLNIGPYSGDLDCIVYSGSPFLHIQGSMRIDQPWVAFIHDSLFYADFETVDFKDGNGHFQNVPASLFTETSPGEAARLKVKHRAILGTVSGGAGTLGVMPPPHAAIYPTDQSDKYGFVQAGKHFIGTHMSRSADFRYRPWIDAPIGSTQRMDVFLVLGSEKPEATLGRILNYTHGDSFKSIPGHYTMAEHFHPEFTDNHLHGRDALTSFKKTMKSLGLQIIQPMEFHGPGHTFNNETERLKELSAMFELLQANSDDSFLLIPGEEYNHLFPGHWSYMFPHPVYFTGWPGQGDRAYKLTNVTVNGVTYPTLYQIGDTDHMMRLLQDEGGIAWSSHPRVKGSRLTPDSFVNEPFYQDDSFQAGDWKAMPMDFSKDRLGFRSFQLMDDTAQWGYRKSMLGEVDTFALDPSHEIYTHMNANYLRLPALPSKTNWSSVVDCVRNGDFFTTTGELLIYSWSAETNGVSAKVEWYFPPAFAEITWGDAEGVHKLKQSLTDKIEFQTQSLFIAADLSRANWVRFEIWDVARNGAFTQLHWFKPATSPKVIAGSTRNFTLIDTETDAPVPGFDPIPNNAVLDRSKLPAHLTIRANISPLVMDAVILELDGSTITRTEWPYSLGECKAGPGIGDSPAYDYSASHFNSGEHVITATPRHGTTSGKPLSLNFSVIE